MSRLASRSGWFVGWTLGQIISWSLGIATSVFGLIVWIALAVYVIIGLIEHITDKPELVTEHKPVTLTANDVHIIKELYACGGGGEYITESGEIVDIEVEGKRFADEKFCNDLSINELFKKSHQVKNFTGDIERWMDAKFTDFEYKVAKTHNSTYMARCSFDGVGIGASFNNSIEAWAWLNAAFDIKERLENAKCRSIDWNRLLRDVTKSDLDKFVKGMERHD